jgi:hypothetical protein
VPISPARIAAASIASWKRSEAAPGPRAALLRRDLRGDVAPPDDGELRQRRSSTNRVERRDELAVAGAASLVLEPSTRPPPRARAEVVVVGLGEVEQRW